MVLSFLLNELFIIIFINSYDLSLLLFLYLDNHKKIGSSLRPTSVLRICPHAPTGGLTAKRRVHAKKNILNFCVNRGDKLLCFVQMWLFRISGFVLLFLSFFVCVNAAINAFQSLPNTLCPVPLTL